MSVPPYVLRISICLPPRLLLCLGMPPPGVLCLSGTFLQLLRQILDFLLQPLHCSIGQLSALLCWLVRGSLGWCVVLQGTTIGQFWSITSNDSRASGSASVPATGGCPPADLTARRHA